MAGIQLDTSSHRSSVSNVCLSVQDKHSQLSPSDNRGSDLEINETEVKSGERKLLTLGNTMT
jgi:hypothetical protein